MKSSLFLERARHFVVAGAVCVAACSSGSRPAQTAAAAAPAAPPTIDVVEVVERPVDVTLDMPGELEPFEEVAIFPRVTGYVTSIHVDRGSRVRAGELLAQLDAPELVAQRAEAESKVQVAEAQREANEKSAQARGVFLVSP